MGHTGGCRHPFYREAIESLFLEPLGGRLQDELFGFFCGPSHFFLFTVDIHVDKVTIDTIVDKAGFGISTVPAFVNQHERMTVNQTDKQTTPQSQYTNNRLRPIVAAKALKALINDPEDTRQVFVVLESLSGNSLQRSLKKFKRLPIAEKVFNAESTLLERLQDQDWLASLPAGSLGRTYLDWVRREQITADGLVEASREEERWESGELKIFGERMRDMHDLWHVNTQYGRDTLGEVCLLGFTFAQTFNPGIAVIALVGATKITKEGKGGVFKALWQGFRAGRRAAWLPGQDWELLLTQPIDSVRAQLNIGEPDQYQAVFAAAQAV